MRKGHPFFLKVPLLQSVKIEAGKKLDLPDGESIVIHSIISIEVKDMIAHIFGLTAKENKE